MVVEDIWRRKHLVAAHRDVLLLNPPAQAIVVAFSVPAILVGERLASGITAHQKEVIILGRARKKAWKSFSAQVGTVGVASFVDELSAALSL